MKSLFKWIAAGALFLSSQAFSLTLDEAKAQGLVGETQQGYLGAVVVNADVSALVKDVNDKRKAKYQQLAKKNQITLEQVEKLAGKKAYDKTAKGHFVQKDGKWVKK